MNANDSDRSWTQLIHIPSGVVTAELAAYHIVTRIALSKLSRKRRINFCRSQWLAVQITEMIKVTLKFAFGATLPSFLRELYQTICPSSLFAYEFPVFVLLSGLSSFFINTYCYCLYVLLDFTNPVLHYFWVHNY